MTRVGQYRLLERIGEGGMGAVFRGEDTMLQRQVAIKVLRPELSKQQTLVDRFRTEAVALARLNHPNIATVFGLLQQDGQYYMVLEYVDGETLEKRLSRRGRLPWSQAVQVAKDVLAALDHAHRMGVVHRDLKPSNLMINRAGQLKVMDFGIARLAGTSRHTEYGRIVGTPLYMSPEQLRGEEVDGRSDVYSLGVVLYELLTGREAFQADSDYALLMAQLNKMPDPASRFVIDLPDMLDNALTRSLAKDRGERWKSASEFRRALLAIVPEPVTRPTEELPVVVEPKETVFADLPAAAVTGEVPATRLVEPAVPATRLEAERAPVTRLAEEYARSTGKSTTGSAASTNAMRTKVIGAVLAAVVVLAVGYRFVGRSSPVAHAPTPAPAPAVVPTPPPAPAPTPTPAADLGSVALRPEPASSPAPTPPGNYGVIVDPSAPKSPKTPKKSAPPSSESSAPAPAPVESAPPPPPAATSSTESTSAAEATSAFRAGASQIGAWLKARDVAAIERSFTGPERDKLLKVLKDAAIELDKPALASSSGAGSGKPTAEYSGTLRWRTAFGSTRKVPVKIAATFASEADGWRLRSWRFVGSPDLD